MGSHLKEAVINFVSKSFVPLRSRIFFHEFLNRQTFDNKTSSVSEIENRAYKLSAGGLRPGDSLDWAHTKISVLGQRRYRTNARKTANDLFSQPSNDEWLELGVDGVTAHAEKHLLEQYKASQKYYVLAAKEGVSYMNQDSTQGVTGIFQSLKEPEL